MHLTAVFDFTGFVSSSGYLAIFLLSVLQSCCIPTSSELTIGFAGVLASQGKLNLVGVIAAAVVGEMIGAYIAWYIGYKGGRAFVDRYGKYILMSHKDLDRAENWYKRHERWGVFGSRCLPVIRNFVAVPAGVAEVPLVRFGILTFLGSLVWDTAMALIGYGVGSQWKSVMKGFNDAGYVLGVLAVAAIAFVIWHRWRSYKRDTHGPTDARDGLAELRALRNEPPSGGARSSGGGARRHPPLRDPAVATATEDDAWEAWGDHQKTPSPEPSRPGRKPTPGIGRVAPRSRVDRTVGESSSDQST